MEEKGRGIDMHELPSERQLGTISGLQCHQLRHSAQATVAWLHIGDGDCRGRKAEEAAGRIWVCQPHSGMVASDVGWIAVGSRIRRAAELDFGRPSFPPRPLFWEAGAAAEGPSQPRALAVFSPTPRLADSDRAEQSKPRRAPSPSLSLHRQCQPDSAMLGSSALSPSPIPAAVLHLHAQIMLASAHRCTVLSRTALWPSMRLQYYRPVMLMYPTQANAAGYPWLHLHELPRTGHERGVPRSVVQLHPRLDCCHATTRTPEQVHAALVEPSGCTAASSSTWRPSTNLCCRAVVVTRSSSPPFLIRTTSSLHPSAPSHRSTTMSQPAQTPSYIPADQLQHDVSDKDAGSNSSHHFQRAHRKNGELELGVTEILEGRTDVQRQVAHSSGLADWSGRVKLEQAMPKLIPALIAEFFGVLFYSLAGEMATAGFLITTYAGTPMGNLTMIGFAYAFGITFAIVVCATTSGGQFHPGFTVAQVVFKGFPIKLAPLYIAAQILGGMAASLIVMGSWHDELMKITHLLEATGKAATIFTAEGPAGAIALFPTPGRSMGSIFVNEFFADVLVAMLVWANLDASNPFTGPQVAPYTIGLGFAMVVWCFSSSNIAANSARDLGARFVCGMFWGDQCFPAGYSALAALTNIPATLVGCGIYTFFLSDTRRPPATVALNHMHEEHVRSIERAETLHAEMLDQKIAQTISRGGDATALQKKRTNLSVKNF
ncbi:aquaporin-like protein [Moesziomyces antarcticus]|uniref:Aquaporin-like protein n=2 Tax=Pseudozyma antarctica TaxID=84753 RepID=A0A081CF56_PSEA2|nr:aquaporin-like protein [Moesziomyces antarcticus]GAK65302.1 aquaporin-like protein [Moesziomyces antarcticus]